MRLAPGLRLLSVGTPVVAVMVSGLRAISSPPGGSILSFSNRCSLSALDGTRLRGSESDSDRVDVLATPQRRRVEHRFLRRIVAGCFNAALTFQHFSKLPQFSSFNTPVSSCFGTFCDFSTFLEKIEDDLVMSS